MIDFVMALIKLPLVIAGVVLVLVLGIVGAVLLLLGVGLTPVLGIGLLIIPIGLVFLLVAALVAKLL